MVEATTEKYVKFRRDESKEDRSQLARTGDGNIERREKGATRLTVFHPQSLELQQSFDPLEGLSGSIGDGSLNGRSSVSGDEHQGRRGRGYGGGEERRRRRGGGDNFDGRRRSRALSGDAVEGQNKNMKESAIRACTRGPARQRTR